MTAKLIRRLRENDTGAASLEYTGMVAVVVLLVGSLVLSATPIGSSIQKKICQAVGATCGGGAAQERFDALTKCVLRRDDRSLGFGGKVRFFNVDRKDGDRFTVIYVASPRDREL